jgi:molybdate transport system substrate-binding protein
MSRLLSSVAALFLWALPTFALPPQALTIAAASDLTDLEPALATAFHAAQPKWEVKWVTAASAVLSQQIENEAPYDVFLSANAQFVQQLAASGKIRPDSVTLYATGQVGMLWRDKRHHDLKDLGQSWVRVVALPNPKLAPYGVAAEQALEHAGIWQAVRSKVVYGENVRQTLELFDSGNADAVLTSSSLLMGRNAELIPANWHSPVLQKAGIVAGTPRQEAAREFLKFLAGPEAAAVFARFGFSKP